MKRQLILGLSIALLASLGGCGPTTEEKEKVQKLLQSANSWSAKGNYDQAIKDYSEAIRLDPGLAPAWNNRGLAYDNKGDYDQAIKDFSEALRLDPGLANAWYHRGAAYKELGDEAKAKADILKAEELEAKAKSKP